jgi:hypothetical protein
VFAFRDGRAVFTPVQAGIIGGLHIEITAPAGAAGPALSADTPVVVGPFQVLRTLDDGAPVRRASASR